MSFLITNLITPSKQLIYVSDPYQTTVNYQTYLLFSNMPKLFQHPRQIYSEAGVAFD